MTSKHTRKRCRKLQTQPPVRRLLPRTRQRPSVPSLRDEPREFICTEDAAYHLSRSPQTLRLWGCKGSGLLTPMRIGRRLAWRVSDIRRLLGIEA